MKINKINPLHTSGSSKTAAYVDVETAEGIIIKGFKIVKGPHGLFFSPPSEKGKDGKYYDAVLMPKELKTEIEKLVLDEYSTKFSTN